MNLAGGEYIIHRVYSDQETMKLVTVAQKLSGKISFDHFYMDPLFQIIFILLDHFWLQEMHLLKFKIFCMTYYARFKPVFDQDFTS